MRWLPLVLLVGCPKPCPPPVTAHESTESPQPVESTTLGPSPEERAFRQVIGDLASALADGDAEMLDELADPELGMWLWGVPGCCFRPMALHRPGSRPAFEQETPSPNLPVQEIAALLRRSLEVATVDPEDYELPPEEELDGANPWGALFSRPHGERLRLLASVLEPEDENGVEIRDSFYLVTHEMRAEHGYKQAYVLLRRIEGRFHVMHLLYGIHYDA